MLGDLRTAVMQGVAEIRHVQVDAASWWCSTRATTTMMSLKPLFARNGRWHFCSDKGLAFTSRMTSCLDYVLAGARAGDETVAAVGRHCKDDAMKLLNLAHQWISSVLPHVLGKVNRVSYGSAGRRDAAARTRSHPLAQAAERPVCRARTCPRRPVNSRTLRL